MTMEIFRQRLAKAEQDIASGRVYIKRLRDEGLGK